MSSAILQHPLPSSSSSSSTSSSSLLQPPNPSLSPTQPPGSILLNRNETPLVIEKGNGTPTNVLSTIRSSFSWKEERGRPPAASLNANRARHSSVSSVVSSSSSSSASQLKSPPNQCIRFAPLPSTGLHRTNSITLGVAARSNLLRTQGCAAGGAGGAGSQGGGGVKVVMTDAEWEEYRRKYESPLDNPPELHKLLSNSTKRLWKKARSLSSSSSSGASLASTTSSVPPKDTATTTTTNINNTHTNTTVFPVSSGISSSDTDLPLSTISTPQQQPAAANRLRSQSASSAPPGGIRRYYTPPGISLSSPSPSENAFMDDSVEPFESDFGSIREEDEDEDIEMDSSPSEANQEDDEEAAPVPAYLRSDLNAERRHFLHEHGQASHTNGQTPSISMSSHEIENQQRAFDTMTAQNVEHETLRRHLKGMNLYSNALAGEGGDGDETPKGTRTPPHPNGSNREASGGP